MSIDQVAQQDKSSIGFRGAPAIIRLSRISKPASSPRKEPT
jgi:hypothetical protein